MQCYLYWGREKDKQLDWTSKVWQGQTVKYYAKIDFLNMCFWDMGKQHSKTYVKKTLNAILLNPKYTFKAGIC